MDFPGGPVVKNLPSSAGDTGSIPGQGTKIPHAMGKQPCATTTEPVGHGFSSWGTRERSCVLRPRPSASKTEEEREER